MTLLVVCFHRKNILYQNLISVIYWSHWLIVYVCCDYLFC